MSFFMTDAIAAAATTTTQVAGVSSESSYSFIMIGVIFALFYFMLIRPQNKRAKDHRKVLEQLAAGDEIIVSGGMLGKIISIDTQYIKVSIAEGVEVTIQRSAVTAVLPKGTLKAL